MVPELNVRRLNAEKKYSGALSFHFEGEKELVEIPFVSFSTPVKAELRYEILEDDSVEISGTLSFSLKGQCSRCLEETERSFTSEIEGYFLPNGDGKEEYAYRNGIIDLKEFLRDSVIFALPGALHCEKCEKEIENE